MEALSAILLFPEGLYGTPRAEAQQSRQAQSIREALRTANGLARHDAIARGSSSVRKFSSITITAARLCACYLPHRFTDHRDALAGRSQPEYALIYAPPLAPAADQIYIVAERTRPSFRSRCAGVIGVAGSNADIAIVEAEPRNPHFVRCVFGSCRHWNVPAVNSKCGTRHRSE